MKATSIIIEIALNGKLEFIHYNNVTVWNAFKQLKKQYGEVLIYNIKTDY